MDHVQTAAFFQTDVTVWHFDQPNTVQSYLWPGNCVYCSKGWGRRGPALAVKGISKCWYQLQNRRVKGEKGRDVAGCREKWKHYYNVVSEIWLFIKISQRKSIPHHNPPLCLRSSFDKIRNNPGALCNFTNSNTNKCLSQPLLGSGF